MYLKKKKTIEQSTPLPPKKNKNCVPLNKKNTKPLKTKRKPRTHRNPLKNQHKTLRSDLVALRHEELIQFLVAGSSDAQRRRRTLPEEEQTVLGGFATVFLFLFFVVFVFFCCLCLFFLLFFPCAFLFNGVFLVFPFFPAWGKTWVSM